MQNDGKRKITKGTNGVYKSVGCLSSRKLGLYDLVPSNFQLARSNPVPVPCLGLYRVHIRDLTFLSHPDSRPDSHHALAC